MLRTTTPTKPYIEKSILKPAAAVGLLTLAWFLATAPLTLVALLVFGIGATLVVVRFPWLAWVGLAAVLPFSSAVEIGPLSATDLLLAAVLAIWFADGVRRRSLQLNPGMLPGLVTIYLAALLTSSLGAVDLAEAAAEVIKWTEVLVVVWVAGQSLTGEQKRWVALGLLAGGALQGLLGLYQFVFRVGPDAFVLFERFMRAAGTFGQPNPYAGYLGLTLPVAVSLTIWAWQRTTTLSPLEQGRLYALRWLIVSAGATALIGVGLLASWSRGGWLGALASVGFVIAFRSRRALIAALIGGVVLLTAVALGGVNPALIPAPIAQRVADVPAYFGIGLADVINQPITDENFSVIERLAHWIAALRMWESAPWLGIGPGNYNAVYPEVRLPRWESPLGHAHNIYLNVLAESGLLGLTAYLLFWTLAIGRLWRQIRCLPAESWEAALHIGVLGVIAHLTVHNFFDNLYVQGIFLHLALWLSLCDSPTKTCTQRNTFHPSSGAKD
ncbi:hypothetical protein GC175_15215 [bacterium]|nr:hypothetical protein [bacterium]